MMLKNHICIGMMNMELTYQQRLFVLHPWYAALLQPVVLSQHINTCEVLLVL